MGWDYDLGIFPFALSSLRVCVCACVCVCVGRGTRDRVQVRDEKPGYEVYHAATHLGFLGGGLGEGDLLEYLPGGDLKENKSN